MFLICWSERWTHTIPTSVLPYDLFFSCRYYIEHSIWSDVDPDEDEDEEEDEEDVDEITYFLSELLAPDGIFAAQMGDAPSLKTAANGNPNMQDRFNFIDGLHENGFVRIVDYEEVCINYKCLGGVQKTPIVELTCGVDI